MTMTRTIFALTIAAMLTACAGTPLPAGHVNSCRYGWEMSCDKRPRMSDEDMARGKAAAARALAQTPGALPTPRD